MTSLTLRDNQIADVGPLSDLTNLTALDLRNNQITDASPLAGLTNLRTLNLTGNAVSNPMVLFSIEEGGTRIIGVTVPHEVIFPDAGLAAVVRETLSLGNGMPILSNKLAALTELDAWNRQITDITGLEEATGLTELDISANSISDISALSNLTNLITLDISHNSISDISAHSQT